MLDKQVICFYGIRHVNDDIQICIDSEELERVHVAKF